MSHWDCLVDCWESRTLEREDAVRNTRRFIVLAGDADSAFEQAREAAMKSVPFGNRLLAIEPRQAATRVLPLQVPLELP